MTYEKLVARIERRIHELETCSHGLCSMSEACGEENEARELRRLLCDHNRGWQVWRNNVWVTVPEKPTKQPSTGASCAACGEPWFK